MTPAPPSPQLRPKLSPFLNHHIPSITTSAPDAPPSAFYHRPSPLGDNAVAAFPFENRDIPGFYVVIPAGGAGTRLWPLSRENHPKFLLDVTLKGRSLIQATWDRLLPLTSAARTTVVAGPSHIKSIRDQLPDLLPTNLFCEPGPKDSMAAIGLAAAILVQRDPEAIIGSFAADHMISGDDAFLSAVAEAVQVARNDYLVTIGIAPSHPSTGFGYIRLGDNLNMPQAPNARIVSSFKEKPDAQTAAQYIRTGNYRWNAGMFVTKASVLLDLLKRYNPDLAHGLTEIAAVWDNEIERQRVLEEVWPQLEKIPIDNAVAEPAAAAGRVAVVPATFGWDDVGDFSSLAELLPAEANQPRVLGDSHLVLTEQVAGGIVVPGSGRLIACLGVDDLVIVDMPDTLLVTTRARSQEVKRLVKKAREGGWRQLL
ncbi:nucleotide-diphospho-sugar transferase [Panaeolus papilionaceus]|nr:nucleotide-diphospho-sugar transferase [Panaeolus papilionaceus]